MKKIVCLCVWLLLLFLAGCGGDQSPAEEAPKIDATRHGVSTENTGIQNSHALQALIDRLSEQGGTLYLPAGEYEFSEIGQQTIGSHCVKLRSNIQVIGDGVATVLKPVGHTPYGLDMFYFNDYMDTGEAVYLENCRFENFVIDASATSCDTYTSAGKGFMINLFRDCHWKNVTVKYTDATGFGVDCPVDSTMQGCTAIGCGKKATETDGGASGFGIGFGYALDESIRISDCEAYNNRKFGFFFEHQGRFNEKMYSATENSGFAVARCFASGNLFGFGGVCSGQTTYENCVSESSGRYGFYFENSSRANVISCQSQHAGEASFAVVQKHTDGAWRTGDISFLQCHGEKAPVGVKLTQDVSSATVGDLRVDNCRFFDIQYAVYTTGQIQNLVLTNNVSDTAKNYFGAEIYDLKNHGNSWNE